MEPHIVEALKMRAEAYKHVTTLATAAIVVSATVIGSQAFRRLDIVDGVLIVVGLFLLLFSIVGGVGAQVGVAEKFRNGDSEVKELLFRSGEGLIVILPFISGLAILTAVLLIPT